MADPLNQVFNDAAAEWNVHPDLLRAVAGQESGGTSNPDRAVSPAGAQGRMQLMPQTARALGVTDTADARQNIYGAAKYLSQQLDKYGSPELALAAYNAGPRRVDQHLAGAPLPAETQAYVPGVTKRYQALAAARKSMAAATAPAAADDPFTAALRETSAVNQPAAKVASSSPAAEDDDPFTAALKAGDAAPPPGSEPMAQAAAQQPVQTGSVSDYNFSSGADDAVKDWLGKQPASDVNAPAGQRAMDAVKQVGSGVAAGVRALVGNLPNGDVDVAGALAPAPNTTYGEVLPLARDNATGALRFALPNSIRSGVQGVNDLIQGPSTGTVSPQATMALAQVAMGGQLGSSVARGSGVAIGGRLLAPGDAALGRSETPDLLGSQFRAAPTLGGAGMAPSLTGDVQINPITNPNMVNRLLTGQRYDPSQVPTRAAAGEMADAAGASAGKGGADVGAAGPRSVGAAASTSADAQLTPAQVQAYRSTAEGQKLLEPQGMARDTSAYVPGVQPNAAEIEQSVNHARELKALGAASPQVSAEAKAIANSNNDARADFFSRLAGSDVDIANAKAARSAQAEADLAATWANKTVADPQPVLDAATEILRSPDGKRPVVRGAINSVIGELRNEDGGLVNDPEVLYGVRKHIDDLMSKEASASDPKSVRAQANLQALKDQLDGVIEGAAPGFRQYLDNFSTASRPIDAMEGLQKFENKLYDSQNRMQYSRVQNMMRQIVDSRASPGLNPYKSIPDDTMAKLWSLRDDLRRSATAADLAKAPGSDTAQNLMDFVRFGGNAALQAGVNAVAPGIGSIALAGAKNAFAPVLAARTARQQAARGMALLRPQTELQNRLLDGP